MSQPIKPLRIRLRTQGGAVSPEVVRTSPSTSDDIDPSLNEPANSHQPTNPHPPRPSEPIERTQLRSSPSPLPSHPPSHTRSAATPFTNSVLGLAGSLTAVRPAFQSPVHRPPIPNGTINPQMLHPGTQAAHTSYQPRPTSNRPPAAPVQARPPADRQNQRQSYQQIQRLESTSVQHQTELNSVKATVQDLVSDIATLSKLLEETVESLGRERELRLKLQAQVDEAETQNAARVADLEEEIGELKDEIYGGEEGGSSGKRGTATSQERRALAVYLKRVLEQLHGEKPPLAYPAEGEEWPQLLAADGRATGPAMRWDYWKGFRDEPNVSQTRLLLNFVKEKPTAVDMPNDTPLSAMVPFNTHVNVYSRALSDIFKQYRVATKNQAVKSWKSKKPDILHEIETLQAEDQGDDPLPAEVRAARVLKLRSLIQEMDGQAALAEGDKKSNIRSKCQSMVQRIKKVRPKTAYNGSQYDFFDDVYCMPPPTLVKQANGGYKAYPTEMRAVYSQQFIGIFEALWQAEDPAGGPSHAPIIDDPPPEFEAQVPAPYWATQFGQLHLNPQRWMFSEGYLSSLPANSLIRTRIVDTAVPLNPDDVKQTQWYLEHPQTLGRISKAEKAVSKAEKAAKGKKRPRSVSIATHEMGPTGTPPGSMSSLPSSSGRLEPKQKKIKSAMRGRPAILEENEDEVDMEGERSQPETPPANRLQLPSVRALSRDMSRLSGAASSKVTPRTPSHPPQQRSSQTPIRAPRQRYSQTPISQLFPSSSGSRMDRPESSKQAQGRTVQEEAYHYHHPPIDSRTHESTDYAQHYDPNGYGDDDNYDQDSLSLPPSDGYMDA